MKSYTDLEQSKKLAEILPAESADMRYSPLGDNMHPWVWTDTFIEKDGIPAWSLAALMNIFPKEEGSCTSLSFGYYDVEGNYISSWLCCYEKEGESTDEYIIETIPADNPVDCCYEMIIKFHKLKML